ncbi:MAG: hypothetical protein HOD43_12810 [Candidatus Marinimicrobia bacterium]|jgi:hypothetical protein|nr:hypothetical protein [Candidatus Neomarinimicrobiota bacterium]MBT4993940.1 hypothetical protein [Candidatus Neomarinimicrobiota bacterium]MBT5313639.1 hypothetical protein [Candidatus Neomarinimicrobiota bacterium]MBT6719634.1 hypothetical protein [Candidatus Neomarinimicrobiota bacterium]
MDIKKGINQIEKSSNPIQRMIIAIVAPIVILLLGYGLINILDVSPDDFDDSWWLWLIIILCIGFFEYSWFRNRDDEKAQS